MAWFSKSKSINVVEQKALPAQGGGGMGRGPNLAYNSNWDIDRSVKEALERVTWVFRCVQAISSNAARVPMVIRKGDRYEGELVQNDALYKVFNSRSSVGETSYNFRYRMTAQLLLSKKGVFIEVIRTKAGDVYSLSLLPSEYVTPIRDAKTFVKGYKFEMPQFDENGNQKGPLKKKYEPEEIIWLRLPHPFDPYRAMTVMDALGLSIETDWAARMYNRNFLLNDGRPGGLVVIKGDVMEEDQHELQAHFRGGTLNAGRVRVITSAMGADFVDTAVTPRDAQYVDIRKINKDEILIGFGVPESVLANASGRTLDNAEIERLVYWMETMMPILELQSAEFDVLTESDSEYIWVDLERVDVLQRMDMKRKEYALKETDAGVKSVDEYRAEAGMDPLANGVGAVLFRPKIRVPWATSDGSPIPDMPEVVNGALPVPTANPDGRPPTADEGDIQDDEPREQERDDRLEELPNSTDKSVKADPLGDLVIKQMSMSYQAWTPVVEQLLTTFYERQKRVVVEKMAGQKMRRLMNSHKRAIESDGPGLRQKVAVETVYDQSIWDEQLKADLRPTLESIARDYGEKVDPDFDVDSVEMQNRINKQMARVLAINTTTKDLIGDVIVAGLLAQESNEDIAVRVESMFDSRKDDRITKTSITEVTAAAMGAKYVAGMGKTGTKTWVTFADGQVRPTHTDSEGQTVPVNEPFIIGGSKMMYPCDPDASVEEVINCRCAMVFSDETTL